MILPTVYLLTCLIFHAHSTKRVSDISDRLSRVNSSKSDSNSLRLSQTHLYQGLESGLEDRSMELIEEDEGLFDFLVVDGIEVQVEEKIARDGLICS